MSEKSKALLESWVFLVLDLPGNTLRAHASGHATHPFDKTKENITSSGALSKGVSQSPRGTAKVLGPSSKTNPGLLLEMRGALYRSMLDSRLCCLCSWTERKGGGRRRKKRKSVPGNSYAEMGEG